MAYLAIAKELAGHLQGLATAGLKPLAWTWHTGGASAGLARECQPAVGLTNDGD
jgi:hypothetical protein